MEFLKKVHDEGFPNIIEDNTILQHGKKYVSDSPNECGLKAAIKKTYTFSWK